LRDIKKRGQRLWLTKTHPPRRKRCRTGSFFPLPFFFFGEIRDDTLFLRRMVRGRFPPLFFLVDAASHLAPPARHRHPPSFFFPLKRNAKSCLRTTAHESFTSFDFPLWPRFSFFPKVLLKGVPLSCFFGGKRLEDPLSPPSGNSQGTSLLFFGRILFSFFPLSRVNLRSPLDSRDQISFFFSGNWASFRLILFPLGGPPPPPLSPRSQLAPPPPFRKQTLGFFFLGQGLFFFPPPLSSAIFSDRNLPLLFQGEFLSIPPGQRSPSPPHD